MEMIKCDIHNVGKTARTHVKCSRCNTHFDIPMDRDWMWTTVDYKPVCDRCAEIERHLPHFKKIHKETDVSISTQILMLKRGYIIVKMVPEEVKL